MRLAQHRAGPLQGQNNHASQSARIRQKKEDYNSCAGRGFRLPRDEATRELSCARRSGMKQRKPKDLAKKLDKSLRVRYSEVVKLRELVKKAQSQVRGNGSPAIAVVSASERSAVRRLSFLTLVVHLPSAVASLVQTRSQRASRDCDIRNHALGQRRRAKPKSGLASCRRQRKSRPGDHRAALSATAGTMTPVPAH
jgi:hypothetical protein